MSSIAAVLLFFTVAGIVIFMKNKKKSARKPETESKTQAPSGSSSASNNQADYKEILDSLLELNLLIRKDKDFSMEMTDEIEAVIDDLTVVIPSMMERYPGETLTYEIKKIGKEHLYKTVKEFLDLSIQSRENQMAVFKQTIDSLHDISKRSRDIVENNETAEFKTMANFLAGKFS